MTKDCESATGTTRMSGKNGMNGKADLRRVKMVREIKSRCILDFRRNIK